VAAVVEDTSEHGGTASGPVVRDIVKAYYDKKNKKTPVQITAENLKPAPEPVPAKKQPEEPKGAAKPEQAAAVVPANEKDKTD
jgi:hypothetical protein